MKVIRPEANIGNLDNLFLEIFSRDIPEGLAVHDDPAARDDSIHPGLAGLWLGPLQEQCVGVVVPRGADDVLQLYARGRFGYFAD